MSYMESNKEELRPTQYRNGDMTDDTIRELVVKLKKKEKKVNKFKHVLCSTSYDFYYALKEKYKNEMTNYTYASRPFTEKPKPIDFDIDTKDFCVKVFYYPSGDDWLIIVFCDDVNEFYDKIKTTGQKYPLGNYYLTTTVTGYMLVPVTVLDEDEPILNEDMIKSLTNDVEVFFKKKQFYIDNHLAYKRGVLMYGPPGNGKTSFIKRLLVKHNKERYAVIIDVTKKFDKDVGDFLKVVLGKDNEKIVVFEDVDGVNDYNRSSFLNFIDGIESMANMFVIATSNAVHKIDAAIINRPSRFDKLYYFDVPNEKTRFKLLNKFFPNEKREALRSYVQKTKGFSGAYFKELFIFVNLQECDISTAIESVKMQLDLYKKNTASDNDRDYLG